MTPEVDKWLAEARRYAKHAFCYEGLVDDHIDVLTIAAGIDADVYEMLDELGEEYNLDRADKFYGIHYGIRFEKIIP